MTEDGHAMRVEELATACSMPVDTIRFYQKLGLVPPPRRSGRVAHYDASHVERLERIRALAGAGFSLSQIKDSLQGAAGDPLLARLVERQVGSATLDREEVARRSGLDPSLVGLAVDSGLLRPLAGLEAERFSEDVLAMLTAARQLLEAGLPVERLAALAVEHAQHVEHTVDAAISLFRQSVPDAHADLVDRLVPAVTRLVADHFERTLVERAAAQLGASVVAAAGHVGTSAVGPSAAVVEVAGQ